MAYNVENTAEIEQVTQETPQNNVAKSHKKSKKIPKCVRAEEFIKLIKVIPKKDIIFRIAVLLSYGSSMRLSEVLACKEAHFRNNSIYIPPSKFGQDGVVPIPKGWKQEFFKQLPLKVSPRTLQRKFKNYAKKAGLPDYYTFHSLRHGFATRLLENGTPINQVQVLMRHSNISTTSVYTKANPLDAIKSYEDLF